MVEIYVTYGIDDYVFYAIVYKRMFHQLWLQANAYRETYSRWIYIELLNCIISNYFFGNNMH